MPAGAVSFRAKVSPEEALPVRNTGLYPPDIEAAILQRFRGKGRIGKAGSKEVQWVEGELLLLHHQMVSIVAEHLATAQPRQASNPTDC